MKILLLVLALCVCSAQAKERVTLKSGNYTLVGYLFKPEGAGPFPGLIWNHGSEKNPSVAQFEAGARIFANYVLLAPVRRGHGDSEGPYIESQLHGQARRAALQVQLLEEQLEDQLAGLAYLKSLPYVEQNRLVVVGCSYGGIQTLLAAERGAGFRAALAISPGALSWSSNPQLQNRLVRAAQDIQIPVLLIQPPRDGSLEPARVLGAEFERLGKPSKAKVYPDTIPEPLQTHCFGGVRRGGRIWAKDALEFFEAALR